MRHTPRAVAASLLLPLALGFLVACGDDQGSGSTTAGTGDAAVGGTIVIASPGDADVLFPGLSPSITSRLLTDMMFDRLAEIGDDLNTVGDAGFSPALARRWTWAPDSLSIAFELDPRARWHDGRPVRAEDVRFTFSLHKDPAFGSVLGSLLGNIDSVAVRDSTTAVIWFKRRTPQQFFDAVYQTPIAPAHVYGTGSRAMLRNSDLMRKPVGSGRFRFVQWEAGARIEMLADTANYRGRPRLDRVILMVVPDPQAAITRLTAGDADFFEAVPADQADRIDSLPDVRVFAYPNAQYVFMGMNLRERRGAAPHPIFGDVRVRRALTMAVDRRAMLRNVYGTRGRPSYGPFPASLGLVDTTIRQLPFDTTAANALLDSAGWRRGPTGIRARGGRRLAFSLLVPSSSAARMAYAVLLQDAFKRVGADVTLDRVDFNTFITKTTERDYDAALQGWGTDPGPGGTRERWSTAGTTGGGPNAEMYSSPAFDAHADSAVLAFDASEARRHLQAAMEQIISDAPAIWLYDVLTLAGVHERLQVGDLRKDGAWWANIAEWHIPEDRRIARDRIGLGAAPTP